MREYPGVSTGEALNEAQDASFVGTVANFDDVTPLIHGTIVFVHLHRPLCDRSEGEGDRSKQTDKER